MTVFAHGRSSASISRRVHRELWTHGGSKQNRTSLYVCRFTMDLLSVSACLGVHAQAIKANQEGGLA